MYLPAGRSAKLAQPPASLVPLKVPAPVPETPTPGSGRPAALMVETVKVPWPGSSEPFEGETMLCIVTGGRLPKLFQVTVELMRM